MTNTGFTIGTSTRPFHDDVHHDASRDDQDFISAKSNADQVFFFEDNDDEDDENNAVSFTVLVVASDVCVFVVVIVALFLF